MLTEEFSIQAEGSRPGAKLCTYILDASHNIQPECQSWLTLVKTWLSIS